MRLGLGTLTPSLAGGNDFAFGGAQTGPTDINPAEPLGDDLPEQVAAYAKRHPTPVPGALYTLDIGANDIRAALEDYASGAIPRTEVTAVVAEAEANTVEAIEDLYALGARSLLFFGVQNLGNTPRFDGTPLQSLADQLSQSFDATVIRGLSRLEADGLKVFDLRPAAMFAKIKADPGLRLRQRHRPVLDRQFHQPLLRHALLPHARRPGHVSLLGPGASDRGRTSRHRRHR